MKKSQRLGLELGVVIVLAGITFGCQNRAADLAPPPGVRITSQSKTHVHADVSRLRTEDFPKLAKIHALYTAYFEGNGATDEKLKALALLPARAFGGVGGEVGAEAAPGLRRVRLTPNCVRRSVLIPQRFGRPPRQRKSGSSRYVTGTVLYFKGYLCPFPSRFTCLHKRMVVDIPLQAEIVDRKAIPRLIRLDKVPSVTKQNVLSDCTGQRGYVSEHGSGRS